MFRARTSSVPSSFATHTSVTSLAASSRLLPRPAGSPVAGRRPGVRRHLSPPWGAGRSGPNPGFRPLRPLPDRPPLTGRNEVVRRSADPLRLAGDYDLVVGADGANSAVRRHLERRPALRSTRVPPIAAVRAFAWVVLSAALASASVRIRSCS